MDGAGVSNNDLVPCPVLCSTVLSCTLVRGVIVLQDALVRLDADRMKYGMNICETMVALVDDFAQALVRRAVDDLPLAVLHFLCN